MDKLRPPIIDLSPHRMLHQKYQKQDYDYSIITFKLKVKTNDSDDTSRFAPLIIQYKSSRDQVRMKYG
ncbi:hypothetical protein [Sphingobacterium arenae]|uniref:Uncharacterized protein n=1 Tax=Sphingobacterium arenae TaxID=1280598 RepID=A0ABR7Y260_9SPHI|nr:hypothetical protein [Sphingobacterium arenae]MBD1425389.1 hypothetical protein [Sphingobacterium arenae]